MIAAADFSCVFCPNLWCTPHPPVTVLYLPLVFQLLVELPLYLTSQSTCPELVHKDAAGAPIWSATWTDWPRRLNGGFGTQQKCWSTISIDIPWYTHRYYIVDDVFSIYPFTTICSWDLEVLAGTMGCAESFLIRLGMKWKQVVRFLSPSWSPILEMVRIEHVDHCRPFVSKSSCF